MSLRNLLLLLPILPATSIAAPLDPVPQQTPVPLVAQETAQAEAATTEPEESRRYPYASLQLGVGFPNDYSGELLDTDPFDVTSTLHLNTGFNAEAAIGYRYNDFRTDLSVGYGSFGVDKQEFSLKGGDDASTDADGAVNLWTVMANVYYDLPIWKSENVRSRWSPYIGAGIGYANLSTPACAVGGCYSGGSSGTFAWQAKLGVSYQATKRGALFLEGGYLGTIGSNTVDSIRFDDFSTWRLNIGWRHRFGGH